MSIAGRIGYWALAVLAVLIALASARFLTFDPNVLAEELRRNLIDHPWPFFIHTTLGPLALILGVWQFLPVTRRSAWHRWAGRLYVTSVLISAIAAFTVAFTTEAGSIAAAGFVILAILWFAVTLIAYLRARAGRYAEHRRWMIRSYALTCAAITLRIIIPVGMASGLPFQASYVLAAWGCWTINLVIAELIIRYGRAPSGIPVDRGASPPAAVPSPCTRTGCGRRPVPVPRAD